MVETAHLGLWLLHPAAHQQGGSVIEVVRVTSWDAQAPEPAPLGVSQGCVLSSDGEHQKEGAAMVQKPFAAKKVK